MQRLADTWRGEGQRIGCVPTMGALHDGHLSLIQRARELSDKTVVSIFVNPIQFGPKEDFQSYPRPLEKDLTLCQEKGVDAVFLPSAEEMYPTGFQTHVQVEKLTKGLCGASRPGHFQGVTTVVTKLFNIIKPHMAIFGAKDYQQAKVIQQMVKDLNFDIQIVMAPTVREASGLALSSRNQYLSDREKVDATVLYQSLCMAASMIESGERDASAIISVMRQLIDAVQFSRIDYIEIVDAETLEPVSTIQSDVLIASAVYIGSARLIDNIVVKIDSNLKNKDSYSAI